jgi:hypothetical protein
MITNIYEEISNKILIVGLSQLSIRILEKFSHNNIKIIDIYETNNYTNEYMAYSHSEYIEKIENINRNIKINKIGRLVIQQYKMVIVVNEMDLFEALKINIITKNLKIPLIYVFGIGLLGGIFIDYVEYINDNLQTSLKKPKVKTINKCPNDKKIFLHNLFIVLNKYYFEQCEEDITETYIQSYLSTSKFNNILKLFLQTYKTEQASIIEQISTFTLNNIYKIVDKNYIPKQEWVYYDEFDLNIIEDIVIKPHIIVGDMIVYM